MFDFDVINNDVSKDSAQVTSWNGQFWFDATAVKLTRYCNVFLVSGWGVIGLIAATLAALCLLCISVCCISACCKDERCKQCCRNCCLRVEVPPAPAAPPIVAIELQVRNGRGLEEPSLQNIRPIAT